MKLFVTVKTHAQETKVIEQDATHLVVSVKALPIEGRANAAVIKALARHFRRAPFCFVLRSGITNKHKVFEMMAA
jgi:uncharacterized protein YggU (UPF0235/DUF167 family)